MPFQFGTQSAAVSIQRAGMFRFGLVLLLAFTSVCDGFSALAVERSLDAPAVSRGADARGLIRAEQRATISAELVARVVKVPFNDGDSFKSGDLLIEFDCDRYRAEHRVALADVKAATSQLRTDTRLQKHGAIAITQLDISKSKFDRAKAHAESLSIQLQQCQIVAPFDGSVVQRHINAFELSSANAPLIEIVGSQNVEVELIVPSKWMMWLRLGQAFSFHVDETGKTYGAVVARLGAVADNVSQTIRVYGRLKSPSDNVLPGMSGTAHFGRIGT